MSEKLNHSDLSAMLAKAARVSGAKSEAFTKTFFDLIIEGLEQDGSVKINGLGTFKVMDVAERSSVNVNTGEKFEIKGHKKLTFVPADTLKEAVNQPFAMFEPVEVDENYRDEDEPVAEESPVVAVEEELHVTSTAAEDILPEEFAPENEIPEVSTPMYEMPEEEMPAEPVEVADVCNTIEKECAADTIPEEEQAASIESDNAVGENAGCEAEPENAGIQAEETDVTNPVEEEGPQTAEEVTVTEERPVDAVASETGKEEQTALSGKSGSSVWRIAAALCLAVLCGVGLYIINKDDGVKVASPAPRLENINVEVASAPVTEPADVKTEITESASTAVDSTPGTVKETPLVPLQAATVVEQPVESKPEALLKEYADVEIIPELAAIPDKEIEGADTTLYEFVGDRALHVVAGDERLAKIANDYYGSRKLWPYIAKYNNLNAPYTISVGMKLRIPELRPKK